MSWMLLLALLLIILFSLLGSGLWIAITLGITGVVGILISGDGLDIIGNIAWDTSNDFILTATPLFLFMGEIILVSGLSKRFYASIVKWLKFIPGGLIHSNILASGMFSAISGSSMATAAAIGSIAIPEMKKFGYQKKHIYGSIASGGTLGILIPPSIVLILYGVMVEESIVDLFQAALIPGILLLSLFLIYTTVVMLKSKNKIPSSDIEELGTWESLKGVVPLVLLIVIVLGSIYSGIITPTESAGMGAFLALIIGLIFGHLNWNKVLQASKNAIKITSMLLFIMIGAEIFSHATVSLGINRDLTSWLANAQLSPIVILVVICFIFIILGFFMDGNSIMFLTIPLLFPVIMEANINPIWFGVIMVILIEIGQITPPLGLNLFVIRSIDTESDITTIVKGAIPYLMIMLLMIIILMMFPNIALWLPSL